MQGWAVRQEVQVERGVCGNRCVRRPAGCGLQTRGECCRSQRRARYHPTDEVLERSQPELIVLEASGGMKWRYSNVCWRRRCR